MAAWRPQGAHMKRDPKPWGEMTPKEMAAHARRLREEQDSLPTPLADNSHEILRKFVEGIVEH